MSFKHKHFRKKRKEVKKRLLEIMRKQQRLSRWGLVDNRDDKNSEEEE